MIQEANIAPASRNARLEAAGSFMASTFRELEDAGVIVRDFLQASDANIWIFGYILDQIASPSLRQPSPWRPARYDVMISQIVRVLDYNKLSECVAVANGVSAAVRRELESDNYQDEHYRLAHIRKCLYLSMALLREMSAKNLLPARFNISDYETMYQRAIEDTDVPLTLIPQIDFLDYLADLLCRLDKRAGEIVLRFRNWKPY